MKRLWLAAPVLLFALRADAVVTATWSVETYQQFEAGDATTAIAPGICAHFLAASPETL